MDVNGSCEIVFCSFAMYHVPETEELDGRTDALAKIPRHYIIIVVFFFFLHIALLSNHRFWSLNVLEVNIMV